MTTSKQPSPKETNIKELMDLMEDYQTMLLNYASTKKPMDACFHYLIATSIGMAMIQIPETADKVIESAMKEAKQMREVMRKKHNI